MARNRVTPHTLPAPHHQEETVSPDNRPFRCCAGAALLLFTGIHAGAQGPFADTPVLPAPFNEERILGVIPDYQTITDPGHLARPLTRREKWTLVLKETADPFNIVSAAMGAAFSQAGNQTPKYGEGGRGL